MTGRARENRSARFRLRVRSISICKLNAFFSLKVNWSSPARFHAASLAPLFRRETVANLICANNTIVSPAAESSGGLAVFLPLPRFSRRRHNANNGRPFSLNGQKGEGKEPRGKSTPVAHCRERSLLTARLALSPPSLSLSLLHSLVLHQSNTLRSSPRKDGRRDSANNKYKPRRELANEPRSTIPTILTER